MEPLEATFQSNPSSGPWPCTREEAPGFATFLLGPLAWTWGLGKKGFGDEGFTVWGLRIRV